MTKQWLAALMVTFVGATRPVPAFPGAEGFGAFTVGGRGGDVYHVVNLNDAGEGSLRYGIQTARGPRTIVFDLSGTIVLASKLTINTPFLTLVGQTAPGDGITVAGWTTSVSNTHDVIVRYMRFRPGDIRCPQLQDDSLNVVNSEDVIIDHVSASWSIDETLSVTNSDRVTVQWSIISESLNNSCHAAGAHGYGSLLRYGSGRLTFHHNLYTHHYNRSPRLGDDLNLDFVNNVVDDWGTDAGYSGAASEGTSRMNYVSNYVVAGPSTPTSKRMRAFRGGSEQTLIFQSDNLIDSNVDGVRDGTNTGSAMFVGTFTQHTRFDFPAIETDDAPTAYSRVLASAGASWVRDAADDRIVTEVSTDAGGLIDSQDQVGGWPDLQSLPLPLDSDQDGIPDEWEIAHGLNPLNPADGAALTESGYSNLEVYLNELVG
jgi:pectate lyase